MLSYLLLGSGFAAAAVIQPGPLQAYLFSSITQRGWRRTLPAALSPLLSDGPIVLTVLLVLTRLPDAAARLLQAAGGLLLLYFAWSSYRQWRRGPVTRTAEDGRAPRSLLEACGVNLLNPNPWLGWTLVMGPAFLAAWQASPARGVVFLISFYAVMTCGTALLILLLGTTGLLGPRLRHTLILVSAVILALLGLYRLALSLHG
ncbi:MAG TPA: LysE family transporter [Anaerolineales bacterium]|nr:LysE family transporter [Anaerolineales bacterium]